ncbi:MAG: hypothetical protein ACLUOF_03205 [Ruminococcus sp.]
MLDRIVLGELTVRQPAGNTDLSEHHAHPAGLFRECADSVGRCRDGNLVELNCADNQLTDLSCFNYQNLTDLDCPATS